MTMHDRSYGSEITVFPSIRRTLSERQITVVFSLLISPCKLKIFGGISIGKRWECHRAPGCTSRKSVFKLFSERKGSKIDNFSENCENCESVSIFFRERGGGGGNGGGFIKMLSDIFLNVSEFFPICGAFDSGHAKSIVKIKNVEQR